MRVISGGQTGVDQAALRAAKEIGFDTGGYMPPRCMTEVGQRLGFRTQYGMVEWEPRADGMMSDYYRERTKANVELGDLTLWFGTPRNDEKGYWCTLRCCNALKKPIRVVTWASPPEDLAEELSPLYESGTLNVAGSRESSCPGIGRQAESFLWNVFSLLKRMHG